MIFAHSTPLIERLLNDSWYRFLYQFLVFAQRLEDTGIFSLYLPGYVYAADHQPYDDSRRRVNGYMSGNSFPAAGWELTRRTVSTGEVYVKNKYQNEYLYATEIGASSNWRSVFTYRPGGKVSQGHWIFEDFYVSSLLVVTTVTVPT